MNATEAMTPGARARNEPDAHSRPLPLARRKIDAVILGFYILNLSFITYVVDVEQLTIPSLHGAWTYPLWPPKSMVDLVHWYGTNFDPLLIARPVWWKMTIWFDSLVFGPYYAFAIYAFWKGKNWIRLPSIIQSSFLFTIVVIILGEEIAGATPTTHLPFVLMLNAPWLLLPVLVIARMYKREAPFSE